MRRPKAGEKEKLFSVEIIDEEKKTGKLLFGWCMWRKQLLASSTLYSAGFLVAGCGGREAALAPRFYGQWLAGRWYVE